VFTSTLGSVLFDTGPGTYPSIAGTHNGTIKLNQTIVVSTLYTYPCIGTGGHTEYVRIHNESGTIAEAHWSGYNGDWRTISFDQTFRLYENETYYYTIRTGSYPQMHHTSVRPTTNGWINCTSFEDVEGRVHAVGIPAIRLF
jgi:hypothetical protein